MGKSDLQIGELISLMKQQLANPVAPILPVAPVAPVAPVLPITNQNPGDHDLLIDLKATITSEFRNVNEKIQGLTDGTARQLADHESRIRTLETDATATNTNRQNDVRTSNSRLAYWGLGITIFVSMLEVVLRYIH